MVGENKENIGEKCISIVINISTTPANVIKIPAKIKRARLYFLARLAEHSEPAISPIGGKRFASPYCSLVIPNVLIAINGAIAAKI